MWGIKGRSRNNNSNVDTTLIQQTNNITNNNTNNNNNNNNNNENNFDNDNNNDNTNEVSNNDNANNIDINTENHNNNSNSTRRVQQQRTRQPAVRTNNRRRRRNGIQNLLRQSNIPNLRTRVIQNNEEWGDPFNTNKDEDVFRIGLRNINGMPIDANQLKNYEIFSDIRTGNFDIFGITETNLAWHTLNEADRLNERLRGKLEFMRFSHSYNKDFNITDKLQYGGTMLISQGSSSGRVIATGQDPCQLGRWSWMTFRGKNNLVLWVVTLYRPVISYGASSTYQQHQLFMNQFHLTGCPREKLLSDLQEQIEKWTEQGERLIIQGDFNEDIRNTPLQQLFQQWGLKEIFVDKHGDLIPNTFIHGSTPIDGMFISSDIVVDRCGYSDFQWGTKSDHRLLWADVKLTNVFGEGNIPMWNPQSRRLKMLDIRVVTNFISTRKSHATAHKLLDRVKIIAESIKQEGFSIELQEEFEEIDRLRVEGILDADRKCRKIKAGEVPWSPTLQKSINKIRYYRACIAKLRDNRNIHNRTLLRLLRNANLKEPVTELQDALDKLKQEYETYNIYKKEASTRRNTYLEDMAVARAEFFNTTATSILKVLIEHERQRAIGRKMRRILGKPRCGVTSVIAPNEEGEWITVTEKQAIEEACQQENIRRFTQANDTPALLSDQVDLLGWTAEMDVAQNILRGIEDPRLHPNINKLVKYFKLNESIRNSGLIDTSISTEEYQEGWRKCKEYTTSGKSGIHFGHFKASCLDPTLTEIDRCMMEISLQTGYSLQRWLYGVDVMIPKKADSIRVDMLRTIVLMEADFNYINKLIGKRVMNNAELHNNIAQEQYGSRKRKSSIIHATNKQLSFDILNTRKQDAALLILDAMSCFDRIAPPIASLSLKRQGAPQSFCNVIFNTIDKMTHFTRTSFGDSEISYDKGNDRFHGILQGNGAGPTIWAMISSSILTSLRDHNFGTTIVHPHTRKQESISAFSFVDDTDLIQTISDNVEAHDISQLALNCWDEDLRTTGGALVGKKCSWFALQHKWQNDKWGYYDTTQKPGDIFIQNTEGENISIRRHDPNEAVMALGVMFSPSGNMVQQVKHMTEKAVNWANLVRTSGLTRAEVWYSLRTMIMKSLEYPLLATTITERELEQIMSNLLKVGLSKSGICRNISRKIVYSSKKYFGLNIRHLYVTQGVNKLKLLLQPQDNLTRHLIDTAWEYCRIESGLGPNFMSYTIDDTIKFYMARSWIFSIWEFVSRFGLKLRKNHESEKRSDDDELIMEKVISGNFTKSDVKLFNWCRIYLQVERISDIITADGKKIRQTIWNGQRTHSCRKWIWPKQPRPERKGWRIWQRILQNILSSNNSGILSNRRAPMKYRSYWTWYYSESETRLYENLANTYYYHSIATTRTRRSNRSNLRFGPPNRATSTPNDLRMCTVYKVQDEIILESVGMIAQDYISLRPQLKWENCINTTMVGCDEEFQQEWLNGQLVLVSDGSEKNNVATGAWILTSENLYSQGKYIEGSASSVGPTNSQDSHRAEGVGLLGGLLLVNKKLNEWQQDEGSILFACDNLSALRYMMDISKYKYISANVPDFDIFQSGRSLMIPNVKYAFKHVKGHQDSMGKALDFLAILNIRMDTLAKIRREEDELRPPLPQCTRLPNEKWHLATTTDKLCRHLDERIYEYISRENMSSYWTFNHDDRDRRFEEVDWEGIEVAMRQLPIHRQHWISKHVVGECGVNVVLVKRREKNSDACKRCGKIETTTHVWKCRHEEAEQIWIKSLQKLETFMENNNTDPQLNKSIISNLRTWYFEQETDQEQTNTNEQQQKRIGWDFFIEGWIGIQWRRPQSRYLESIKSKTSVRRWVGALIVKLWEVAWDLWEHRNGVEHAHATQDLHLNLNDQIRREVEDFRADEYPDMIYMFRESELDKIYESTIGYKRSWLRNVAGARAKGRRRIDNPEIRQMRQTMRQFLNIGP